MLVEEDTAFCKFCSLGEGMWCSQFDGGGGGSLQMQGMYKKPFSCIITIAVD